MNGFLLIGILQSRAWGSVEYVGTTVEDHSSNFSSKSLDGSGSDRFVC